MSPNDYLGGSTGERYYKEDLGMMSNCIIFAVIFLMKVGQLVQKLQRGQSYILDAFLCNTHFSFEIQPHILRNDNE